jgi:hypothetical protein
LKIGGESQRRIPFSIDVKGGEIEQGKETKRKKHGYEDKIIEAYR